MTAERRRPGASGSARSGSPVAGAQRTGVAVLGGTFDHLHAGHRALLSAAFRQARQVKIGLATDGFARSEQKPFATKLQTYRTRRRHLVEFLRHRFGGREWTVVPLNDRWGGSVGPGVDLLVVSEETRRAGRPINEERRRRGLPAVRVYVQPQIRADDGRPISSRRIRAGEIDREGRSVLRKPGHRRASTKS